ncbi:Uu.00g105360.m01.CDS01 [Anthostomella pinea]|uniref:Uu.00g105360.m01.CDS01 n=1 Tax=Anthostomella pinea TaxID=933095 RepID=A0AAI8VEY2_9PEZI|nr:Uu.00g105360.m01.CDS01 [Anthostomella pinea]
MLVAIRLTTAKQKEIRRSINAWIGQHLLVKEEADIGTLQGLLVFIAWEESHSSEEKRAFLACYYFLSVNSSQFSRCNTLKSDYVATCVESLEQSGEFATDMLLTKQVKFRQVVDRIAETMPVIHESGRNNDFTSALYDELESIRAQLERICDNVAYEHPKFVLLWTVQSIALLRLYLPVTYLRPTAEEGVSQRHLQCMLYGLQAARTFFTTVASLGAIGLLYCPFPVLADWTYAIGASSRLLLVSTDGWDLDHARRTLDLPFFLDDLIAKMTAASQLRNEKVAENTALFPSSFAQDTPEDEEEEESYKKYANKIRVIKAWYEERISAPVEDPPQPHHAGVSEPLEQTRVLNQFFMGLLGYDSWNMEF